MIRIVLIVAAVTIVAGAFPAQSHQIIDAASQWLTRTTDMITPGQQVAVMLIALLLALAGVGSR